MEANKAASGKKSVVGIVLSDKMQKTIVVRVSTMKAKAGVGKLVQHSVKFKVHDEKNSAKVGDKVEIEETRPLSKEKSWRLVKIVEKAVQHHKKEQ